ncbi:MAG: Mth938-like domain-containing protein [Coxiellaceae bacterium]|nr:Mth938-like domain-containing protein [Coxiellaceae bacterium]
MMQILEEESHDKYVIRGYTAGKSIKINHTDYQHSLIISSQQLIDDWQPQSVNELTTSHWQAILELKPTIALIGTGEKFHLLPHELLAELYENNIGVECMDTGAACRTFAALQAEGRSVAAALLIH